MKMMITNGGPHPADKWADTTTEAILDLIVVADDADTPQAMAARQVKRDLRPILFDIFMGHHQDVQHVERDHLKRHVKGHKQACSHLDAALHEHENCPGALAELNAALATTPFAEHFAKEAVQAVLLTIIAQHSANVQHIERKWHVDRAAAAKGA